MGTLNVHKKYELFIYIYLSALRLVIIGSYNRKNIDLKQRIIRVSVASGPFCDVLNGFPLTLACDFY